MANKSKDIYRSHTPYAFVFIGEEFCYVENYDLSITTRGEASSCKLRIPLENVDSTIFAKETDDGKYIPIELYVGYLQDDINERISNQVITEFATLIRNGKSQEQKMFNKRFIGFAAQPEWIFGDERYLNLNCYDWSQILREYKWPRNFKDGDTEIKRIVSLLEQRLEGIKIVCDPYSGIQRLGETDKDPESGKISHVYRASGQTYWQILEDCATKLGKRLFVQDKTIYITRYKNKPVLWNMYYGPYEEKVGLKHGQYFRNLSLRYGEIGESNRSNVVIDLYSHKTTKKTKKEKPTYIRYPENAPIKANTRRIVRNISVNTEQSELKVIAENLYKKLSRKNMTGNLDIPFANNFLNLLDLIQFSADKEFSDLQFIKDYYFSVNSINENYGPDGYGQTIEIDTNPDIDKTTITIGKNVAPAKLKPQNGKGRKP